MSGMQFIVDVIKALAWPAAIVAIVAFLALVDALLFAITTQREWSVAGAPQIP